MGGYVTGRLGIAFAGAAGLVTSAKPLAQRVRLGNGVRRAATVRTVSCAITSRVHAIAYQDGGAIAVRKLACLVRLGRTAPPAATVRRERPAITSPANVAAPLDSQAMDASKPAFQGLLD